MCFWNETVQKCNATQVIYLEKTEQNCSSKSTVQCQQFISIACLTSHNESESNCCRIAGFSLRKSHNFRKMLTKLLKKAEHSSENGQKCQTANPKIVRPNGLKYGQLCPQTGQAGNLWCCCRKETYILWGSTYKSHLNQSNLSRGDIIMCRKCCSFA